MKDIEIARNTKLKKITEIAEKLNIQEEQLEQYGKFKAKISPEVYKELKNMPYDFGATIGYSMITDDLKSIEDAINESVDDMKNKKQDI